MKLLTTKTIKLKKKNQDNEFGYKQSNIKTNMCNKIISFLCVHRHLGTKPHEIY